MKLSQDDIFTAITLEDKLEPYYLIARTLGFEMDFRRHMSAYILHLIKTHNEIDKSVNTHHYHEGYPYLNELADTLATLKSSLVIFGFDEDIKDNILGILFTVFIDASSSVQTLKELVDPINE